MDKAHLAIEFARQFGEAPQFEVWAPARVNLIGEHIDYCGGEAMPMAITRGTLGLLRSNPAGEIRARSLRFNETITVSPTDPQHRRGHWGEYVAGVVKEVRGLAGDIGGFDLLLDQDIGAAGLSSSASFCVSLALSSLGEKALALDGKLRLDIARLCRRVENDHVGVACGIMDQMSIVLGHINRLDCESLSFRQVTPDFGKFAIVIMDSGVERTLAASGYNERVAELEEIAEITGHPMRRLARLGQLGQGDLEKARSRLPDRLHRRLRHVVSESERVGLAERALADSDWRRVGELLNESHASLRDDYEVSCAEIDFLVEQANRQPSVRGARMTGGGFGGCAICLAEEASLDTWLPALKSDYRAETGKDLASAIARPGPGAFIRPL